MKSRQLAINGEPVAALGRERHGRAIAAAHSHPKQLWVRDGADEAVSSLFGPRKIRALYQRVHGQAASESNFKRILARAELTDRRRAGQDERFSERAPGAGIQRGLDDGFQWLVV